MTVNSVGALLNKDGSFAKINEEGVVEEIAAKYNLVDMLVK